MANKKSGPGAETGTDVLCCQAEQSSPKPKSPEKQPIRGAPLHLIGSPSVTVTNRKTETLVSVQNPPWGWGNKPRAISYLHTPLHTSSPKAERDALELRQQFANQAWKKHAELEREKDQRLREIIARNGGGK